MSRIIILCEGDTEEIAVRHFLCRQWETDGLAFVGLSRDNLNGDLSKIGAKANLYLEDEDVVAVFTLVDLYGMNAVVHAAGDDLAGKVQRARAWLRSQVSHARSVDFYPHVSVHEIEAWLLAEGAALSRRLGDRGIQPDTAAELKNFQNPPSVRINDLFLSRKKNRYHKITDGRPLFSQLAFDPVYRNCQNFRSLYDDLRAVARSVRR